MRGAADPPTIPGWTLLGHLGEGGMGSVWKARRADGTLAALKVVRPPSSLTREEAAALFRREALVCFSVVHPGIVRALDAGTTPDGDAYLALEYVEGRTLQQILRRDGALAEDRVRTIGIALAAALCEVHRLGLVHRDVKPSNVMLDAAGGLRLLDFGIVVESGAGADSKGMGTPAFLAPEVRAGRAPDPRADLFSLGATLHAAATGLRTGAGDGFADAELPAETPAGRVSAGLRQIVRRLLRRNPDERYRTAAEVVLDLEAVAAGERPLGAILGSAGARAVRRGPRALAWVAAAAAAAGLAVWGAPRLPSAVPGGPAPADTVPGAGVPADGEPAPPPRSAAIESAAAFLASFPDDFVRGRDVLDRAAESGLPDSELGELAALRREFDSRVAAAAAREFAAREPDLRAAAAAGDVPEARRLAAAWPAGLAGAPEAGVLRDAAEAAAAAIRAENESLSARVSARIGGAPPEAPARDWTDILARIDAALARPAFDGDGRERLPELRRQAEAALASLTAAQAESAALAEWDRILREHLANPSPARLRASLGSVAAGAAPQRIRAAADGLAAALARAEQRLVLRLASAGERFWCGPIGNGLGCGKVSSVPDDVLLSPLWEPSGGRAAAVADWSGGADEGAAWLFSRGLLAEARTCAGPGGAVAELAATAAAPPRVAEAAAWPAGIDPDLALRPPGTSARASRTDALTAAWESAIARPKARPAPLRANPAKIAGRDGFLAGELAAAAQSLTEAALADPCDAEVAALRGRILLAGARALPTAPALLAAVSEGRRAWDLDPRLPAGPLLVAEAGIDLVQSADPGLAARLRPVVAAACDATDAAGRADGRILLFAGECHLEAGRPNDAAQVLRRALAARPDSGPAALLLARAEHACGRTGAARDALRRARENFGGTLPPAASVVARELGM